ncbi:MAG TPA: serine hydrolase [Ruminococcaceae bacterium]|nr:serine hydrolase [Oscillospiraceae bacterium]
MINEKLLEDCLDKIFAKKHVHSTVMRVESEDAFFVWEGARGDMRADSKFFIASVTKMYIAAVIMQLIEENKLSLDEKIAPYLSDDIMRSLHVYKGRDYSGELTVKHLLSNTSGLPDYFFGKEDGKRVADMLMGGADEPWGLERSVNHIKKIKPKFAPGRGVEYSDVNFQLLGKIVESLTGQDIGAVFSERIFRPLGLHNTYSYKDPKDTQPVPFYHGARRLWLPVYMASAGPDGGIVSTANEITVFAKAFWGGRLFPRERIDGLKQWRLLTPPPGMFYFGIGLEKQPTPWILSPRKPISEIVGFWGQTSAYTWYNPDTGLYFSGTANQTNVSGHTAIMNAIIKMIKTVR